MNIFKWAPYFGDHYNDIPVGEGFVYQDAKGRPFGYVVDRGRWVAHSAKSDRLGDAIGKALKCLDAMKIVESQVKGSK